MKSSFIRILMFFLLLLATYSCGPHEEIKKLGYFVFPDNMVVVLGDSIIEWNTIAKTPMLFYLLDSTKCMSCEYNKLYNFEPYYKAICETDTLSFFAVVIPNSTSCNRVDYIVEANNLAYPIVIDKNNTICEINDMSGIRATDYAYIYINKEGYGYKVYWPIEKRVFNINRILNYFVDNIR